MFKTLSHTSSGVLLFQAMEGSLSMILYSNPLILFTYAIYGITVLLYIVIGTREAALDAQIISLVSDLGDQQLRNIKTDIASFDPRVFNQKIVSTDIITLWSHPVIECS